jgi:hypothetical protein
VDSTTRFIVGLLLLLAAQILLGGTMVFPARRWKQSVPATKKLSGTLHLAQETWRPRKPKVPDTFFVHPRGVFSSGSIGYRDQVAPGNRAFCGGGRFAVWGQAALGPRRSLDIHFVVLPGSFGVRTCVSAGSQRPSLLFTFA